MDKLLYSFLIFYRIVHYVIVGMIMFIVVSSIYGLMPWIFSLLLSGSLITLRIKMIYDKQQIKRQLD